MIVWVKLRTHVFEGVGPGFPDTDVIDEIDVRTWEFPGAIMCVVKEKPCTVCAGTGEERSGVCHCGDSMEGHSLYANHGAVEMTRTCNACSGRGYLD